LGANSGLEGVQVATSSQPPDQAGRPQPAEWRLQEALAKHPLRHVIFTWVLWNARRLIRNRENLRFERTRLFGRARMIFVELGHRFYAHDRLDDPRDIFYLEVDETLSFVDGSSTTTDLKGLVKLRRTDFERYWATASPPSRFETHGIPYVDFGLAVAHSDLQTVSPNSNRDVTQSNRQTLTGLGCSPGRVRGQVRVVTDPKQVRLQPGEILVAKRTDPGWIMLFPAASGLLVEHGSLLSHSAIVSREMGLPAVVALEGVTRWLSDGDWVEFDGSTGEVRKVESVERCQAK
jgi:pyruvate,water dikinase